MSEAPSIESLENLTLSLRQGKIVKIKVSPLHEVRCKMVMVELHGIDPENAFVSTYDSFELFFDELTSFFMKHTNPPNHLTMYSADSKSAKTYGVHPTKAIQNGLDVWFELKRMIRSV